MVLLRPVLEGELAKCCTRCATVGLCSPVKERSTFYPKRTEGSYRSECRCCTLKLSNARHRQLRQADPEEQRARGRERDRRYRERNLERRRERDRVAARLRRASDPAARVRERENRRRYIERLRRERPKVYAARLEVQRMNHQLRKERQGMKLQVAEEHKQGTSEVQLPVGPFLAWVDRLLVEDRRLYGVEGNEGRVAAQLGVSTRTLYRWRHQSDVLDEVVVDRAVSREGSVSLWDLYPEQLDYVPGQQELAL